MKIILYKIFQSDKISKTFEFIFIKIFNKIIDYLLINKNVL